MDVAFRAPEASVLYDCLCQLQRNALQDMTDFRDSVKTLLKNVDELRYEPRKWVTANYGDQVSGTKLRKFVEENFADRVMLPDGTRLLFPSGA
eukprot:s2731_g11.t1